MASATKITISLILLSLVLVLLVSYISPNNHIRNLTSTVTNLPLTSTSRLAQHEDYVPNKRNEIRLLIEEQLANARGKIRKAIVEKRLASNETFVSEKTVYNNPFAFLQSYNEMMKTFKIWVYKEGDAPLAHNGPMKCIYSIEGDFIQELERKAHPVLAKHPDEAHAFFIPISVTNIVQYLYTPSKTFDFLPRMQAIVEDYIGVIAERYPYWNRSNGADHFYVACHDWGPFVSQGNPKLFENLIRVLCNANTSEGFKPRRDVSIAGIYGPGDNIPLVSRGQSPYSRSILAFFAGGNHGFVRNRLFQYWGNKEDNDIQVHSYLPKGQNYTELLSQSKYCLCPSGYEVGSARLTEAIHMGCVPVVIKNNYVLPHHDVLDWSQFSVQVAVSKIPDLKRILEEIPFSKYMEMQNKVMEVQRHFTVNIPAKNLDVFHMILHSVWLRRLNVQLLLNSS
uniref:probable glycosyltransferase At5g20260 n=1 Tax=Erigeron canadensis TaxID=72917 RepID=UPI001CB9164D|nr:probable glycosyltransferase At5g20260 [Erigeron canadensis]